LPGPLEAGSGIMNMVVEFVPRTSGLGHVPLGYTRVFVWTLLYTTPPGRIPGFEPYFLALSGPFLALFQPPVDP